MAPFIARKEKNIEAIKAARGQSARRNGFIGANTVKESGTNNLLKYLSRKDKEKVNTTAEVNIPMVKLRAILININSSLDKKSWHSESILHVFEAEDSSNNRVKPRARRGHWH